MSLHSVDCCCVDCFKRRKNKNRFVVRYDHLARPVEKCQNPWISECRNTDIEVYITHEEQQLPICTNCWRKIADENYEWRR